MKFQNTLPSSVVDTAHKLISILLKAAQDGKKFAIVSHANDDFDSLASIYAMLIILKYCIGVQAKVFFDYPSNNAEIIERNGGILDLKEYVDLHNGMVFVILVDANDINALNVNERGFECPLNQADVVIDHHSVGIRKQTPDFEIRCEKATSAISLLLEIIEVAFAKKPDFFSSKEFATLSTLAIRAMSNDVGMEVSKVKVNCKVLGSRACRYWHKLLKKIDMELYLRFSLVDPRFDQMKEVGLLDVNQKRIGRVFGYFLGVYEQNDLSCPMARFVDEQVTMLPKGSIVLAVAYVKEGNYVRLAMRQNNAKVDLSKVVQRLCPNNGGGRANAAVGRKVDPYHKIWKQLASHLSVGAIPEIGNILNADTFDEPTWFASTSLASYVEQVAKM